MALTDLANRAADGPAHKQCGTCWALDQLSEEERQQAKAALANPAVRYSEIYEELDALGLGNIDHNSVGRHARGNCGAPRLRGPK